jgi:hypothetical protein
MSMKRSASRVGLVGLLILIACGVAGFELWDRLGLNTSSEAKIRQLGSFWVSRRRAAASELAQFPGESAKVVPALVKSLGDSDTEVRLNALASLKAFGENSRLASRELKDLIHKDSDPRIRQGVASLLGMFNDPDAVNLLV